MEPRRAHLAVAMCLLVVGVGDPAAVGAPRATSAADVVVEHRDCTAVLAEFRIPERHVRPVVPPEFRLPGEDTRVAVMVLHCADVLIDGRATGETTYASLRVLIQPYPDEGEADVTDLFHHYVLWHASDNAELIRHLQQAGGLTGNAAVHVRELAFSLDPLLGTFTFDAPPPTPSPFTIVDGRIGPPVTAPLSFTGDFFSAVPRGVAAVVGERVTATFGEATGRVVAQPHSQLDRLFCNHTDGRFGTATKPDGELSPLDLLNAGDSLSLRLSNAYTVSRWEGRTTPAAASPTCTRAADPVATGTGCTGRERQAFLRREQAAVRALVGDLATLRNDVDLARLAVPNPHTGTAYNAYPHQFVSLAGMGFAVLNTGEVGPGKPDLLFYAPPGARDVTDPYGPDFPYTLAGWGYLRDYEPGRPPILDGACLDPGDWFVHERSVHVADTWHNVPVPPDEAFPGQVDGRTPPLPHECDPACVGLAHGRVWAVHLWAHPSGAARVSMLNIGRPIPGVDPGVGTGFFSPEVHE